MEEKVSRGENKKHGAYDNGCCMEGGQKENHCSGKAKQGLERIYMLNRDFKFNCFG